MGKKKFTLTIEESVRDRAKDYADRYGISVSEMVEKYLDTVTREDTGFKPESGSWTESITGIAKLPSELEELSYKEIKRKKILKKYGR